MNYLWAFMLLLGTGYGLLTGRSAQVTEALLSGAADGIELCLTMLRVMALWTGMMEIGERSGLVRRITRRPRLPGDVHLPDFKCLFPPAAAHDHDCLPAAVRLRPSHRHCGPGHSGHSGQHRGGGGVLQVDGPRAKRGRWTKKKLTRAGIPPIIDSNSAKCGDKEEYTACQCPERRRRVRVFVRGLWK